ncbi:MAG: MFS transporter [Dehalococcoidales bacterium]|nr:MAG: MFS transporter [Dehalococcoidales bacterium]
MRKFRDVFYGWWVLIALFLVGNLGPMGRYSITAFFPALSSELAWSRSTIGTAQSVSLWAYSILSILTGWMTDRLGSRKTIFIGGFFCLVGWILLSQVNSLWQLYCYYGLIMAIAVSNTHLVPLQATSRKWFVKRAGLASGIISSAFAIGSAIFIPLLTLTSSIYTWRQVSLVAAFITGIPIMFLAYFIIRDTPESIGQHTDGINSTPDIVIDQEVLRKQTKTNNFLKTPQFWLLFAAYGLIGIVFNGILAHLVIWAVDLGSSNAAAGVFVTVFNGPSILARIGSGWLGDKYGKRRIMILGASFSALVMLMGYITIHSANQLIVYAVIFGIGAGFSSTLFAPYLGDLFGRQNIGSSFGILTLSWGLIGGMGPTIWGIVLETFGSYNVALLISVLCYAIAGIMLFLVCPLKNQV